jgi:hypothetical protein
MAELEELQKSIVSLFRSEIIGDEGKWSLSMPCIPRISERYLNNRIVVVGQETNYWGKYRDVYPNNLDNLETLAVKDCYDDFVEKYVQTYRGKFWDFQRHLYNKKYIEGPIVINGQLSHAWINLFQMEACQQFNYKNSSKGKPTANFELREHILSMQNDILYKLLTLLNPRLIIFLTGHGLDDVLIKYGLNNAKVDLIKIDESNVFDEQQICEFKLPSTHVLSKAKMLRLSHPTYFMWKMASKRNKYMISKCNELTGKRITAHYIDVVNNYMEINVGK